MSFKEELQKLVAKMNDHQAELVLAFVKTLFGV